MSIVYCRDYENTGGGVVVLVVAYFIHGAEILAVRTTMLDA